jgi:hypothetical protein
MHCVNHRDIDHVIDSTSYSMFNYSVVVYAIELREDLERRTSCRNTVAVNIYT